MHDHDPAFNDVDGCSQVGTQFPTAGAWDLADAVHIRLLDLQALVRHTETYRRLLNPEERLRAERYRVAGARNAFVLTRGCLREMLGEFLEMPPAEVALLTNEHGKPRLAGTEEGAGLVFSVSHSGERAMLAFTRDTALGVDTELIRAHRDLQGLARQCLSANEWDRWRACSSERQAGEFTGLWVCKEAFVKATGRGIALGLTQVDVGALLDRYVQVPAAFLPAEQWHLSAWEEGEYRYAVAYSGRPRAIRLLP